MKATEARPWLKNYSQNLINRELPKRTLYEQIKESNKDYTKGTALEYYGAKISYAELFKQIDIYAQAFTKSGVKKGDFVSFYTVTIPETVYAMYALNKIGAVCNLIDVRTDATHTAEFIAKAKSDTLVVLDLFLEKIIDYLDDMDVKKVIVQSATDSLPLAKRLAAGLKSNKKIESLVNGDEIVYNRDFVEAGKGTHVEQVAYEPDTAAVVVRTGGTTGRSKGVVLTNDNMNAVYEGLIASLGQSRGESVLNFLPFAASYGVVVGIHVVLCSSVVSILVPKFSPDQFGDLVCKHKPNHIVGVPVFYEYLMNHPKAKRMDLSFLITMGSGGDTANPMLEKRLEEFNKTHGVRYPVASGYGMSETGSAVAFGVKGIHRAGSVGIPSLTADIAIFEPGTTRELEIGEVGEICISGPCVIKEYLDEPEETANVKWTHEDGKVWIHSGDLGCFDEDGFLYIKGRIKRSIIRFDGHKNYPTQIEEVAAKHPAVENCSVIAIKDSRHDQGELPLVIAELKPDYIESHEELSGGGAIAAKKKLCKDIHEFCCDRLELRSHPYAVVIIDSLPITSNGKIDVRKLAVKYQDFK